MQKFALLLRPVLWLTGASIACVLVYWSGLNGPFLFDDTQHLRQVESWLQGEIGFWAMAAGNGNLIFHRALAMASLGLNAVIGGESSFSFKLGNLTLHLLCGWVAYATLSRLLQHDKHLGAHAKPVAALICAVWLLHPLNVSTVLYVVQRMSQIATLFPLLGIWLYAATRNRMQAGLWSTSRALAVLFVTIPLLTFLGVQGKQSAIILPGLCLVVELGWFQRPREWPAALRWFYLLSIVLPAFVVVAVVIWKWQPLQASMLDWGMTPLERLISEPRAIWGYIRMLLVPHSQSMGLYTDDFPVSRGLLQPLTTLPALFGLIAISVAVWFLKKRLPATFVGWFWFLVAHSIEASIVPIELYYEHRNYLPAFGLLLMAVDLVAAALRWLAGKGIRGQRIAGTLAVCVLMAFGVQTLMRAQLWRSSLGISLAAIESHPNSARAHIAFGYSAMQAGLIGDTYLAFQRLASNPDPALASIGKVELTVLNCYLQKDSAPALLQEAASESPAFLNSVMQYAISNLVEVRNNNGCGRITAILLADAITQMVNQATAQPEASQAKWSMRFNAALAYHQGGDWDRALEQSRLAWKQSPDPTIALFHVKLLLHAKEVSEAKLVFWQVMDRAGYKRLEDLRPIPRTNALRAIRKEIDTYAASNGLAGIEQRPLSFY
ncbi:hypothetical protein [Pseudoxanthomonas wuyuanensis]|uniref:Tetratricopeptide repeat-containing protein n=1 Tax=Pseudoxanthomonas wuyuanensis TaxID=1073196 RepID=A0A286DCM0_9GAMM|nr:hypothetical protein [Pseudoxanthomonas wuyuanensis]KAF1719308.1 hypothetical protein CSC75_15780 [Pseudoxanthomonas wuyuanensis]SOD56359.1 hypothetical protein SAMN06296416_10994 [Pseudoxanthomonas wuyuanensis]